MKNKIFLISIIFIACHRPEVETHKFVIVSECHLPGYAKDIDIKGNYAYIANDQGGLQIVNISDVESTFMENYFLCPNDILTVAVRDTLAFFGYTMNNGGMYIFNIKDPMNPKEIFFQGSLPCNDICAPLLDTAYVYIAGGATFYVDDVSPPESTTYVRNLYGFPGNFRGVFMVDSIAYLACEQVGLLIFDLSKPNDSVLIGSIDTPSNARNLVVLGNYAYVADGRGGLVIIDVSNPKSPVMVGTYDTPGYANGVFVNDGLVYVADGDEGLQVIDVSNPENPQLYGELKTSYAYNLYVRGDYIYLVDRDLGLVIIKEEKE